IREGDFKDYHYETFVETLCRYPNRSFKMWQEGIKNNLFYPQFHGREHINVNRWMYYLNSSDEVRYLFNEEVIGVNGKISGGDFPSFVQALEIDNFTSLDDTNNILKEGLSLFKQVFGYS